jgi:hypothetical protein
MLLGALIDFVCCNVTDDAKKSTAFGKKLTAEGAVPMNTGGSA